MPPAAASPATPVPATRPGASTHQALHAVPVQPGELRREPGRRRAIARENDPVSRAGGQAAGAAPPLPRRRSSCRCTGTARPRRYGAAAASSSPGAARPPQHQRRARRPAPPSPDPARTGWPRYSPDARCCRQRRGNAASVVSPSGDAPSQRRQQERDGNRRLPPARSPSRPPKPRGGLRPWCNVPTKLTTASACKAVAIPSSDGRPTPCGGGKCRSRRHGGGYGRHR